MESRNLTCIGCPMGCLMTVEMENGEVTSVTGNTCKRGDDYARKEVTHPTRIVTSSVYVTGGAIPMVSVKTAHDIPKEKINVFEDIDAACAELRSSGDEQLFAVTCFSDKEKFMSNVTVK